MAKKSKSEPAKKTPIQQFKFENSVWFAPVMFAIMFLALMILFSDFIFSDKMLRMSDQINAGVFFRTFLVEHYQEHGSFPQWMPHIFGGMPYIEAFHGDIFYPLSMAKFLANDYMDYVRIQGWTMILHFFLAGIFMYLTARRFRLSKIASITAATGYMFAAYLISLIAPGHDGKIYATTLFPLTILFLQLGFGDSRRLLWFSCLGATIGLIILAPHPQMSYFTLWAVSIFAAYKLICLFLEKKSIMPLLIPASLTTYAVVLGLLVSAIQFYPGYIYTNEYSPRADTKKGWDWATSWSLHEEETFSLLIPEFSGTTSKNTETYYWGKNYFKDNSESVGTITLFLGLLGLFFSRRRDAYFFGGLSLFALLYALGATTPIFNIFYYLIPKVQALRAPSMIMFLFSFSISILAGFGVQAIIDASRKVGNPLSKKFNNLLFGFPSLLLLIAVLFGMAGKSMLSMWSSIFHSTASTQLVQQGVTKLDVAYLNLGTVQTGAWFAFLFSALVAGAIWMVREKKASYAILLAIPLLGMINDCRFNNRFVETDDAGKYWAPNPVSNFFAGKTEKSRVLNLGVMPDDLLPFHGIDVAIGYHGNQLRWYDDLIGGPGKTNQGNPNFINVVGAKYILAPSNMTIPPGTFGPKPVRQVASFGQAQMIQNDNALKRLRLFDEYIVIEDRFKLDTVLLTGSIDFNEIIYLEQEPKLAITVDSLASDSAWFIDYENDSILIGLNCNRNSILMLADNYYDAWHVSVDGQPAELLRSNGSFRAVEVPAGTSQVLFKYESERYQTGKTVTLWSSIFLALMIGVTLFSGFRPNPMKGQKEEQ